MEQPSGGGGGALKSFAASCDFLAPALQVPVEIDTTTHTRPEQTEYPDRRRHLQTQAKANNAQQPPWRPRPFPPPLRLLGQEARPTLGLGHDLCSMQAPEVRVCSIFVPISISISISVKGSSKSSPIRHLELVNVRYPFHASPVPPFVPPCRYVLALQARTTGTAAVRCGAQPGAGCPCATRRRSGVQLNPPPPASPESSISRGRVEAGTPRCRPMCSGEPAPSPQPHRPLETPGDGTPHPLIRSASAMPCTLCILCCYDAKCAVACCPSVSVRYLLSRHTLPTDQPPSGVTCAPAATSCCRTRCPLPC